MQFLPTLLLALAANTDNFAIGTAYGHKGIRIGIGTNTFIALVSGVGTFLSVSVGLEIGGYLSPAQAGELGSFALLTAGAWALWVVVKREQRRARRLVFLRRELQTEAANASNVSGSELPLSTLGEGQADRLLEELAYETFLEHPEKADRDRSGYIDINESITLAFGLSANNLAIGIGAGISGCLAVATAALVIVLSFLGLALGYLLGRRFSLKMPGLWAGLISGGLVILTGLREYFLWRSTIGG